MMFAIRAWLRSLADRSHYRRLFCRELERRIAAEQLANGYFRQLVELRAELHRARVDLQNMLAVDAFRQGEKQRYVN